MHNPDNLMSLLGFARLAWATIHSNTSHSQR
jgi:hypothetical protein